MHIYPGVAFAQSRNRLVLQLELSLSFAGISLSAWLRIMFPPLIVCSGVARSVTLKAVSLNMSQRRHPTIWGPYTGLPHNSRYREQLCHGVHVNVSANVALIYLAFAISGNDFTDH